MQNANVGYRLWDTTRGIPLWSVIGYRKDTNTAIINGFSFMELMVVVAIMSILIIASLPVFRDFARSRNIDDGALMIVSSLRKTREASITYRKHYRTVLDTVKNAVAIYDHDNGDELVEKWQSLPELVVFDTTASDWDIPVAESYDPVSPEIYYLEFKANGGLSIGTTYRNVLIREKSTEDTRVIEVNGLTGKIEVEEW